LRQHADLHRVDLQIGEHRVDLRGDERRWHIVNAGHAQRVLGGERGDHARAIDAERRESLEVSLDAGAAAGIGARDGDRDRGHGSVHALALLLAIPWLSVWAELESETIACLVLRRCAPQRSLPPCGGGTGRGVAASTELSVARLRLPTLFWAVDGG